MCPRRRAHWHDLANTIEPSICSGDAVLYQITLTTCYSGYLVCKKPVPVIPESCLFATDGGTEAEFNWQLAIIEMMCVCVFVCVCVYVRVVDYTVH